MRPLLPGTDRGSGEAISFRSAVRPAIIALLTLTLLRLGSALGPRCSIPNRGSGAADAARGDEPSFRSSGGGIVGETADFSDSGSGKSDRRLAFWTRPPGKLLKSHRARLARRLRQR
jgi:hypothetical protein